MFRLINPSNQDEQVQIPDSDQIRNIENQILAIENRIQANGASIKDFNDLEFLLLELKALNEKEDRRIKKDFDISDIENIPYSKARLMLKKGLYYLRSLFK
jgi:hypothetical protein